jgi:hypothetical protein
VGDVDLWYVLAGLAVPAATYLGLRLWSIRSSGPAPIAQDGRADARSDGSDLAQSVVAVQARLKELTDQLAAMSRDWEERDRRLTEQIQGLIGLTEQAAKVNAEMAVSRRGSTGGARRDPRP